MHGPAHLPHPTRDGNVTRGDLAVTEYPHGCVQNVVMLRALTHVSTAAPARAGGQRRFTGGAPGVQRRIMAAFGAVFVALVALFALAQPAAAEGEQVSGRLENRIEGTKTPISGVTITVVGRGLRGLHH